MQIIFKVSILILIVDPLTVLCGLELIEEVDPIGVCVANVIENWFTSGAPYIYVYSEDLEYLPQKVVNPLVIVDVSKTIRGSHLHWNNYVVEVSNVTVLKVVLDQVVVSTLWNPSYSPKGRFVIVLKDENPSHVFPILWKLGIINAVVVVRRDDEVLLLTCHPNTQESYCGKVCASPSVHACIDTKLVDFPSKISNYNRCPITVAMPKKFGKRHDIRDDLFNATAQLLADNFNVTIRYSSISEEQFRSQLKVHPIALYYRGITWYRKECEYGNAYAMGEYYWKGPEPQRITNLGVFSYPFTGNVWAALFLCLLTVTVVWYVVAKLTLYPSITITSVGLKLVSLSFGIAIPSLPKLISLRVMLAAYLIFVIHIHTAYNSNLINILVLPYHAKVVTSDEELANTDLPIFVHQTMQKSVFGQNLTDVPLYERIRNKVQFFKGDLNVSECFRMEYRSLYDKTKGKHIKVKKHIFVSDVVAKGNRYSSYTKKGHYFLETFNEAVDQLIESGTYIHVHDVFESKRKLPSPEKAGDWKSALELKHLVAAFLILLAGLVTSLAVFLVELFIYRFWK